MKIEITTNEFIGRQVKKMRQDAKIKQKDFAKIIRVSPMMLSHLENGNREWKLSTLNEVALYFHKDIMDFISPPAPRQIIN